MVDIGRPQMPCTSLRVIAILTLADINKGFDLMHQGKSIRSVVVF